VEAVFGYLIALLGYAINSKTAKIFHFFRFPVKSNALLTFNSTVF